jgi:hypothetical protein
MSLKIPQKTRYYMLNLAKSYTVLYTLKILSKVQKPHYSQR